MFEAAFMQQTFVLQRGMKQKETVKKMTFAEVVEHVISQFSNMNLKKETSSGLQVDLTHISDLTHMSHNCYYYATRTASM